MFFLKEGENLMIVLQQRFHWKTVLFQATEVHTHYSQRKGVPPAQGICPTSGHWIFVAKILGNFQCDDFTEEISKLPTNKDLAFVTVPFSFMLRDIYADTNG